MAAVHVFAGKFRFLQSHPRSVWLSLAGGASVAYVIVHLVPELRDAQSALASSVVIGSLERHVYVIALSGLVLFYGLERAAKRSRAQSRERGRTDRTSAGVFWIHTGSFFVYNVIIGYLLLHREIRGIGSLILFSAAMLLHFLVNDYGLREDHKEAYTHIGRWILAAAVLNGWAIGATVTIHPAALAVVIGFLAGGVILNVLKEELPEERESSFSAFLIGAAAYAAILLSV